MKSDKFLRLLVAALSLTACSVSVSAASGDGYNLWTDPDLASRHAAMWQGRIQAVTKANEVVAQRDSEAVSGASCTQLEESRKLAAVQFMERGQPPDPSRVIQNSTCFLDVLGFKIPVSLTGIGFLDGMISSLVNSIQVCAKATAFASELQSSALSQISSQVSGATGGSLNLNQLTNPNVSVNVGGQNLTFGPNSDVMGMLQAAGNTAAVQAVNNATANIGQSTYNSINGTMDPNSGQALANAQLEVKQVQCQQYGVGTNETCPCPTADSLAGGVQWQYPQCSDTYSPWYYSGNDGGGG